MNLTEEKKTPLREQTIANKKQLLIMHCKKSNKVSLFLLMFSSILKYAD